ncbi:hypothetical protein PIB30_079501 [Stylosanthes scabra]|uniref:Reverse transcriptase zinc-binding domain-containing protein n=1 Tax=Stylosanthes scabra TaxID=79078 RepID=A0ABU6RRP5_9FABA|nr:hypothetical protein [Stylosanthes scabra]
MGTDSLLARNTRVNRAIHDREGFLLLDSMTCDLSCKCVSWFNRLRSEQKWLKRARGSRRSRRKAWRPNSVPMHMHQRLMCVRIAMTWVARRLKSDPMRTHLKRVVTLCPGCGVKCADDLSRWSLRATDGRNRVNLEPVWIRLQRNPVFNLRNSEPAARAAADIQAWFTRSIKQDLTFSSILWWTWRDKNHSFLNNLDLWSTHKIMALCTTSFKELKAFNNLQPIYLAAGIPPQRLDSTTEK